MSNCKEWRMLRLIDITLAALGLMLGLPVFVVLLILCYLDTKSPLFFQTRVGRLQKPFVLVKFRTMKIGTASVATHLADATAVTSVGRFMRKSKLDEIPQLWNVLKGDMSFVGPRPCLPNQIELIDARQKRGVYLARPGITGLAQINEIDMSTPELLAQTDAKMLEDLSLAKYVNYIMLTVGGRGGGDRIDRSSQ